MSEIAKLKAARALISDPRRWTQGVAARSEVGAAVNSMSPKAVSWCALGAYSRVAGGGPAPEILYEAVRLLDPTVNLLVSEFNDAKDHADVLALFDKAIQLAEAAPHNP